MDRLLNFTAGLSVALIVLVLLSVRRAHIRVEYSVSWLAAAVALLALSGSPKLMVALSDLLGVSDPPVAFIMTAGCVFLFIFYRYSVILSRLKDDNIALAQKVAMLEYRLDSVTNKG